MNSKLDAGRSETEMRALTENEIDAVSGGVSVQATGGGSGAGSVHLRIEFTPVPIP
jgi:hypothetical protein